MRILVLAGGFPKENEKSDGNYVFAQVAEMKELGHDVLVVSPTMYFPSFFKNTRVSRFITSKEYKYRGIDVIAPRMFAYYPTSRYWTKYPRLFSNIYNLTVSKTMHRILSKGKYDIVYSMGSVLEAGVTIKLKKWMPELKFVYIEHSAGVAVSLEKYKQYRTFYSDLVNAVDKMLFVSTKQKISIESNVALGEKYEILNNGFTGESQQAETLVTPKEFTVISVGFLEERKGYMYSIEALSMLKKDGYTFKYVIVGDGKEKEKYIHLVSKHEMEKDVEFKGRLPHDQVLHEMANADVFLLPSWDEAFGIVYLEAMSCGIPVIGTLGEGIEDVVVNNENGFLVGKQDVYSIYVTIKYLIDHPADRIEIGKRGKMTTKNYSWEMNAQKLIDIFKKIVEN